MKTTKQLTALAAVAAGLILAGCCTNTLEGYGVKADAKVAPGCWMTANEPILHAGSGQFSASDIGKKVVVYDAGKLNNGFRQPLSSTIKQVNASDEVELWTKAGEPDPDGNSRFNSSRTVYGHDDTEALQKAVDAQLLTGHRQKTLYLPGRHILTQGFVLDGSVHREVVLSNGPVYMSYDSFRIVGRTPHSKAVLHSGQRCTTLLENWNVDTSPFEHAGIIWFKEGTLDTPLTNIVLESFAVRQVLNATEVVQLLVDTVSTNVTIRDGDFASGSYEGVVMNNRSQYWLVSDCSFHDSGHGGPSPGRNIGVSALSLGGSNVVVENNLFSSSDQGIEMGPRHGVIRQNTFIGPRNGLFTAINIGNSPAGVWDNTISGNTIIGWGQSIAVNNGDGLVLGTTITGNTFEDSGPITIQSGLDENPNLNNLPPAIHGETRVTGNRFEVKDQTRIPEGVFICGGGQAGLESVTFDQNTVQFDGTKNQDILQLGDGYGGGPAWKPNTPYTAYDRGAGPGASNYVPGDLVVPTANIMVPPDPQDSQTLLNYPQYYYRCIKAGRSGTAEPAAWPITRGAEVVDNEVIWRCEGFRPTVTLKNTTVIAKDGTVSTDHDILIGVLGTRAPMERLQVVGHKTSYKNIINGDTAGWVWPGNPGTGGRYVLEPNISPLP